MRVAFIGAGKMASQLMDRVDELDDVSISAVCDIEEDAAAAAAGPRDATTYTDHETMFEEGGFDAVFVAIPPFAYDDQATLAAEYGIDVFVEKPVGLRPEDAREVEAVLADGDVITSSGYVFRYDRITERADELVGDRDIALLSGRYWSGLPGSPWGHELESSGGEILTRTTHVHDLARYFGGDVSRVTAAGTDRVGTEGIDYDDATGSLIEHENGVVTQVASAVTSPEWTVELDIVGDDFRLSLDYANQTLEGTVDGESVDFDGSCDRYGREVEAFLEASRRDDQNHVRSSYSDAVRTLELGCGVIDAAQSQSSIEL